MVKHYSGDLGNFNYDTDVWELDDETGVEVLKLRRGYTGKISLPHGIISCEEMFKWRDLTGCWFEDFDTFHVINMAGMFEECTIPEGFSLGNNFDTSNVTSMCRMFSECKIPNGFSLGDKFNTSKVESMCSMFFFSRIPEGFSLGDKFSTSSVKDMSIMFSSCKLPKGFSLGNQFDTSSVEDMSDMFEKVEIPKGFSFGNYFNTSKVIYQEGMFSECTLSDDKFFTDVYGKDLKEAIARYQQDLKKKEKRIMHFINEENEVDEELLSGFKRELADIDGRFLSIDILESSSHMVKLQIWCNNPEELKQRLGVLADELVDYSGENDNEDYKYMYVLYITAETEGYYEGEYMSDLELNPDIEDEEKVGTVYHGIKPSVMKRVLQNISSGEKGLILDKGNYYYYNIKSNKERLLHRYTEIKRLPLSTEVLESTELEKMLDFKGFMYYLQEFEDRDDIGIDPSTMDMYKREVANLSEADKEKYMKIANKGVNGVDSWKILTFDKSTKEFVVGFME